MTGPGRHGPARRPSPPRDPWAPWWVYLIVLLPANALRAALVPGDTWPLPVTVVIAAVQAAVLFVVVTAVWRRSRRG